jgi:hypothetical protein
MSTFRKNSFEVNCFAVAERGKRSILYCFLYQLLVPDFSGTRYAELSFVIESRGKLLLQVI